MRGVVEEGGRVVGGEGAGEGDVDLVLEVLADGREGDADGDGEFLEDTVGVLDSLLGVAESGVGKSTRWDESREKKNHCQLTTTIPRNGDMGKVKCCQGLLFELGKVMIQPKRQ